MFEIGQCMRDVVGIAQMFVSVGQRNARALERFAATALGAEVREIGIAAVDGNTELHGERALERCDIETGDVRRHRIGDHHADTIDQ